MDTAKRQKKEGDQRAAGKVMQGKKCGWLFQAQKEAVAQGSAGCCLLQLNSADNNMLIGHVAKRCSLKNCCKITVLIYSICYTGSNAVYVRKATLLVLRLKVKYFEMLCVCVVL